MKHAEIPHLGGISDALVYGNHGDYMVKINGQQLQNRKGLIRRFATADAAVKMLTRNGITAMRVVLGSNGGVVQ